MHALAQSVPSIPAMSEQAIDKTRRLEATLLHLPQIDIPITHFIHAGLYARTAFIPAGVVMTGALIKIDTVLAVVGEVSVYIGDEIITLSGHNVLRCSAGRKQVFVAHTDTHLTMLFSSNAETVEEAEKEFTDESDKLTTTNFIGGELCLE